MAEGGQAGFDRMSDGDTRLIPVADGIPYPLGRAGVHHDPANRQYRALVHPPPRATVPNQVWYSGIVYDQGDTSRCTTEAAIGLLNTEPHRAEFHDDMAKFDHPAERQALFITSLDYDPWVGNRPEDGTSTDAPWRVLRERGVISGWRWLFGEPELREYVTWYGPVVAGTIWRWDMFTPDYYGYLNVTGPDAGGHAYRIVQYSAVLRAYRIVNSWGLGWGRAGRAWIRQNDMAALLQADGELVTLG